ncbi:TPA: methyltransferase domain-containing protein [Salmonella enterica subsp. enterica serovar Bredeney]|uniref:Methyltransferase domain-containing protein n=3 Tax=Salmonella enterica TaxID=28901 RepID=A0A5J1SY12_SALET|nr:methyltransferase domain-containing protein [Salmonella enterica]EAA2100125.1 methyltransferase domain-containing protein [Salmonella enterica subsp. enterica serovar Bredeney]EAA7353967.1 methyltransferase domain-containing protein [Salmonella enterica subsp. enterica]EAB7892518.1 methyltransferase domain-containing protein [Salmonella enterica subsp. enterica serovar Newport]EBW5413566.1 methyltransferase domain-containing protein [Salmonella enterica subsp. enterica serovar Bonn]EBY74156
MLNVVLSTVQPWLKHQVGYVRQFIKSPRTFGSLAPSSPWLCNRMAELADWTQATTVAELGAGDGVLTRRLLDRMASDAQLDAWEIQPELAGQLRTLAERDHRLQVFSRSAERLERHYDIIFSCLPLLSIPVIPRLRILNRVRERLNPGGVFIQFQYSTLSEKLLSRYFEWTRVYEVRNIPPAWIYVCTPHRKNTVQYDGHIACPAGPRPGGT